MAGGRATKETKLCVVTCDAQTSSLTYIYSLLDERSSTAQIELQRCDCEVATIETNAGKINREAKQDVINEAQRTDGRAGGCVVFLCIHHHPPLHHSL